MPRRRHKASSVSSMSEDDVEVSAKLRNTDIFDAQTSSVESGDEKMEDDEYKVEKIIGKQYDVEKGWLYHVKWKGWDERYNSWEPEENCQNCLDLIKEYNDRERVRNSKLAEAKEISAKKAYRSDSGSLENFICDKEDVNPMSKKKKHSHKKRRFYDSSERCLSQGHTNFGIEKDKNLSRKIKKTHSNEQASANSKFLHTRINSIKIAKTTSSSSSESEMGDYLDISFEQPHKQAQSSINDISEINFSSKSKQLRTNSNLKFRSKQLATKSFVKGRINTNDSPTHSLSSVSNNGPVIELEPSSNEEENNCEKLVYKVPDDDGENGFTREWKLEKVLAFTKRRDNVACAIIKFKGFKLPQQIPLSIFKKYDKAEFLKSYRNFIM